jgi:hypothetical protein
LTVMLEKIGQRGFLGRTTNLCRFYKQ